VFALFEASPFNNIDITDFVSGTDKIDLSKFVTSLGYDSMSEGDYIDSNTNAANATSAAELRFVFENSSTYDSTDFTALQAEVDGELTGVVADDKADYPFTYALDTANGTIDSFEDYALIFEALIHDGYFDGATTDNADLMQLDNLALFTFDETSESLYLLYDTDSSKGNVDLEAQIIGLGTSTFVSTDIQVFPELLV
jgi:hypothetical protein